MNNDQKNLSRGEKILLCLFELSHGKTKIRYEDIVVGLFKKYPHDFQLKGYPQYPDSGDLVHKPLYDFKKKGYMTAANKVFSLTDRGVEFAKQLAKNNKKTTADSTDRLSRSTEIERSRVKGLEGFLLFLEGEKEKLSDNDFYNYLGVTVRTSKSAFIGRLETMSAVAAELKKGGKGNTYKGLVDYHNFLLKKFDRTITFFTKN